MDENDILFGPIRPEGSHVSSEKQKAASRAQYAQKKAMKLATGRAEPKQLVGSYRSELSLHR